MPVPQIMEEIVEVCKVISQEHIQQCTVVEWVQEHVVETIKVIPQDMKVLMQKDLQQLRSLERSDSENFPTMSCKQLCRDRALTVVNELVDHAFSLIGLYEYFASGSMHQQHTSGQARRGRRKEGRIERGRSWNQ